MFSPPYFISIHALREEGDMPGARKQTWNTYFYPRPPRGGRQFRDGTKILTDSISIHALREEGDVLDPANAKHITISIHALREEGDFIRYSAHASW